MPKVKPAPHKLVRRAMRSEKGRFISIKRITRQEYETVEKESQKLAEQIQEIEQKIKESQDPKELKLLKERRSQLLKRVFDRVFKPEIEAKWDELVKQHGVDKARKMLDKWVKDFYFDRQSAPSFWGFYVNYKKELLQEAGVDVSGGKEDIIKWYERHKGKRKAEQIKTIIWEMKLLGKSNEEIARILAKKNFS